MIESIYLYFMQGILSYILLNIAFLWFCILLTVSIFYFVNKNKKINSVNENIKDLTKIFLTFIIFFSGQYLWYQYRKLENNKLYNVIIVNQNINEKEIMKLKDIKNKKNYCKIKTDPNNYILIPFAQTFVKNHSSFTCIDVESNNIITLVDGIRIYLN